MADSGDEVVLGKRNLENDCETKPILKKQKRESEEKETTKEADDSSIQESFKSDQEGASVVVKDKLFITCLSPQTQVSDIINFFENVAQVVRVQLSVNSNCKRLGYGIVEFASDYDANKALQQKNGQCLHDRHIVLKFAKRGPTYLQPKYCIDHKVWYKDYSLEDETHPGSGEEVVFVANISPQTDISHINDFFANVGDVVSVRLVVNHEGKHVGYGFVEFASADVAEKALGKNGGYLHDRIIFVDVVKMPRLPLGPRDNRAGLLSYEDCLRRGSLLQERDETLKGLDEFSKKAKAIRIKTLEVAHLSRQTSISDIINFFKDVGEVVNVRLIVDKKGKHVGYGLVEFASGNEAKKALQEKNGEKLGRCKIVLHEAKIAPYPPPKLCIDHNKAWYKVVMIEEDDQAPDAVKEIDAREKTLFVANLSPKTKISEIIEFFKNVAQVVRVRLIVNRTGGLVGCGVIEFASAVEAKKALQKKNGKKFRGQRMFLDVVKTATYPL